MPDTERTVDIELHVEVDGEEIHGRARTPGGADQPFTGWIGLLSVLDRTLTGRPGDDPAATA